jgi:hypothetical protein
VRLHVNSKVHSLPGGLDRRAARASMPLMCAWVLLVLLLLLLNREVAAAIHNQARHCQPHPACLHRGRLILSLPRGACAHGGVDASARMHQSCTWVGDQAWHGLQANTGEELFSLGAKRPKQSS